MRFISNPQLEGDTFFWEGGPVGILLVHGFTATAAEVRPLGERFHEAGYTVAGPLLPGHGTTPQALNRCRWQEWAEAVEALYGKLSADCDRVFVGGESMGGLLALHLAIQHPEIAGVITYAAALELASKARSRAISLLAPFVPMLEKPRSGSDSEIQWQGYRHYPLAATRELLALQRRVRSHLTAITHPLLIFHGARDTTVSRASPEIIYRSASSSLKAMYELKHSGHCVVMDRDWELVAQITLDFIAQAKSHRANPAAPL